ncbi:hypothetical protein BJ742DRAFT_777896 [Cladochytrium replicatum]|nr:hypothetical protein BJ742DRAFT_777896 [Cladochytrium replicatum]
MQPKGRISVLSVIPSSLAAIAKNVSQFLDLHRTSTLACSTSHVRRKQRQSLEIEVVLLEARDRLGGRMHNGVPRRVQRAVPVHAGWMSLLKSSLDLTAETLWTALINQQLTIPVHALRNAENCRFHDFETGTVVEADLDSQADFFFNEPLDKACRSVAISYNPVDLEIIPYEITISVRIVKRESGPACALAHVNLEFAYESSVNDLTLYHWDNDDAYRYGQVAHRIAKGRPSQKARNIEYNAEVKEVSSSEILLLHPPTPTSKTSAIDCLGFGFFNKVILVFSQVFWPIDDDSFGTLAHFRPKHRSPNSSLSKSANATPTCTYTPQAYESQRCRSLVAFVSGAAAQDVEDESDTIVVRKAMAVLARVFPEQNPLPRPVESILTRWA